MQIRSLFSALLVAPLLWLSAAHAEPPVKVQNEVNFLLGYVAGSGCEFYRNGSWYGPQKAHSHLRDKYRYLTENNMVSTTEQFIERAASVSSFSGKPYQIRCAGSAAVSSQQWLREKLLELRAVT
ncbi:MAG TPA: DUF5329 domain-containing protein [Ramlibacter sp.]|nr:DUF5329 domain-containing protein [Ramlibacter sp.]